MILKIKKGKDFSMESNFCPNCDCYDDKRQMVRSQFENWVISTTVHNIFQGRMQAEVCQSLKVESTNRLLDFGDNSRIPENSSISDMLERVTEYALP